MAQNSDANTELGFAEIELDQGPSEPIGRIPQNAHCNNCKTTCGDTSRNICILWTDKEADNIEKRSW